MMNRKKKLLMLIILLTVFCITAGTVSAVFLMSGSRFKTAVVDNTSTDISKLDDSGSALDGQTESKTSQEVLEELQKDQINVTDRLGSCIVFSKGKAGTPGDWAVENPADNRVVMQCEVYLGDELVAKATPIRPGQHIENVPLLKDLKAGTYDVTAYVNYYAPDTSNYIGKAGYQIKLTVQ